MIDISDGPEYPYDLEKLKSFNNNGFLSQSLNDKSKPQIEQNPSPCNLKKY